MMGRLSVSPSYSPITSPSLLITTSFLNKIIRLPPRCTPHHLFSPQVLAHFQPWENFDFPWPLPSSTPPRGEKNAIMRYPNHRMHALRHTAAVHLEEFLRFKDNVLPHCCLALSTLLPRACFACASLSPRSCLPGVQFLQLCCTGSGK